MLCETVEQGKTKCEQYWPTTKGEKMTFGDITVESVDSVDTDKTQVGRRPSAGYLTPCLLDAALDPLGHLRDGQAHPHPPPLEGLAGPLDS